MLAPSTTTDWPDGNDEMVTVVVKALEIVKMTELENKPPGMAMDRVAVPGAAIKDAGTFAVSVVELT